MNKDKLLARLRQLDRKRRFTKLMAANIGLQAIELQKVPSSIALSAHIETGDSDSYAASIDLGVCSIVCDDSGKLHETTAR